MIDMTQARIGDQFYAHNGSLLRFDREEGVPYEGRRCFRVTLLTATVNEKNNLGKSYLVYEDGRHCFGGKTWNVSHQINPYEECPY